MKITEEPRFFKKKRGSESQTELFGQFTYSTQRVRPSTFDSPI